MPLSDDPTLGKTAGTAALVGSGRLEASGTVHMARRGGRLSMGSANWFLPWAERTQLAVPIIIEEVRQDRVMFTFDGWPCLNGSVQPTEISIWAYRGEEPWDGIFDIDIQPIERDGRWVCGLCWDA